MLSYLFETIEFSRGKHFDNINSITSGIVGAYEMAPNYNITKK